MSKFKYQSGQSLMEIVISLTIGVILIGAAAVAIIPILRNNAESQNVQIANSLAQEYVDNLQNLSESNWLNIYNPPAGKGPNSQFYLGAATTTYQIFSGASSTIIQGLTFTRYFSIENVSRSSCGIGDMTTSATTTCPSGPGTSGIFDDPSTQKITVTVSWPTSRLISRSEYLTRTRNKVFNQSDWSGGPGQEGPITVENNKFAASTGNDYGGFVGSLLIQGLSTTSSEVYGTTIDSSYHYAWNDVIGWLDFYSTQTVSVGITQLYGYATSSVGYIALDCETSPNGNICSNSNFQVLNNIHSEGQGNNDRGFLSGYAWNDAIGWISFDSDTSGSPYDYQVRIKGNGDFTGWAWNDIVGWISFNCNNVNCNHPYKVKTSWASVGVPFVSTLTSSIFDTQATSGVALNTIMWQGILPLGTSVTFQIASSNSASGPWNYIGPDGSSSSYYAPAGPGSPVQINAQYHNNQRYFRYKMFLFSNADQTLSPQVDNMLINWSP